MKKVVFLAVIMMLLICTVTVHSQENRERSNAILISPFVPVVNIFQNALFSFYDPEMYYIHVSFDYQRKISNNFSISLTPIFSISRLNDMSVLNDMSGNQISREDDYWTEYEYSLRIGAEYRPHQTGLNGAYIGLYPSFGFFHENKENYKDIYSQISLAALSGYQWIFSNGFSVKLGGGIGYDWLIPFSDNKGEKRSFEYLFDLPFNVYLDFLIGYSF